LNASASSQLARAASKPFAATFCCASASEREAAGVAEAVEHVAAGRVLRDERAVVALVDVEARLVAVRHVDVIAHAVLVDDQRRGRRVAREHAGGLREPFLVADRHVGALVHVRAAGRADQRLHDRVLPRFDARGHELAHELAARRGVRFGVRFGGIGDVVVDDQPRQAVGFAEHEAHRARARHHRVAVRDRALHAALEERVVDRLGLVEAPHAHADLRLRAVRAAREEAAVVCAHDHGGARRGLAVDAVDRIRVDPRMPALQRFVLGRFEGDGVHDGV